MDKEKILETMSESEGFKVEITDVKGEKLIGIVELYETRYDNSDDDVNAGEASICVDGEDGNGCLLYESDIKEIKIIG